MAVIDMPFNLEPVGCTIGQWLGGHLAEVSETTGESAERVLGPPRWQLSLRSPEAMTLAIASRWEVLQLRLRGGVNHLAAFDPVRAVPRGTLRGVTSLAAAAMGGASTATLAGCPPGATLLPSDWLQIGTGVGASQLVKVVADAVADGAGVMQVTFEPPLRKALPVASLAIVERARGYFKAQSAPQSTYKGGRLQGGFALDLMEDWTA